MTQIAWILGCLTVAGAVVRAFFEHLFLKVFFVPVEDRSYLQRNELFGHIEHGPVRTFGESFCICFFPGLITCLLGSALTLPAALQLFVMGITPHVLANGRLSVMFFLCVVLLVLGLCLLCYAFPTYEDALYLWESRKQAHIVVRILLFVPIACMRAGAFLARFGVWQIVAIALLAVSAAGTIRM